jgi:glycosyltransferase involved in cell wall biosynthesis
MAHPPPIGPVRKPTVLVLIDFFLPGEKAGGPVRTLAALIHHLGGRASFLLVTRDRDPGDTEPYRDVPTGRWVECGGRARCRYLGPKDQTPWAIARLLRSTPYDVLYVNTLFSVPFSLVPLVLRRWGIVSRRPVVLAPRGQLNPGALSLKRHKKRVFLAIVRRSRLYKGVVWQASSEAESTTIHRWFGSDADVRVASDLRIPPALAPLQRSRQGDGPLRVVFVSRIVPMKNLVGALEILSQVKTPVTFDIYGAREDPAYWRRCEDLMRSLPAHVQATYRGVLAGAEVHGTLARYDLMLLPTLNENYGHVIAEALAAGCPPLISDGTPWRDLERRGVGWDLPLEDLGAFRDVLDALASEPPEARAARAEAAMRWMVEVDADEERMKANARLFGLEERAS